MRMLCCPFRSPFRASNLFPGGTRRFSRRTAASKSCNLLSAVCWMFPGSFLENWRCQILSVSAHLKRTINLTILHQRLYPSSGNSRPRKARASNTGLLALLQQSHSNAVSETTWQLGSPPAADSKEATVSEHGFHIRNISQGSNRFYFLDHDRARSASGFGKARRSFTKLR